MPYIYVKRLGKKKRGGRVYLKLFTTDNFLMLSRNKILEV